jgi:2,3-bisphosphoglycerate-independent phosphoglycerate mutase
LLDKVKIASLSGRYYGMDRDNRWDRQKLVYELLTEGKGNYEHSIAYYIKSSYKKAITDEFLIPTLFEKEGIVKDSDTIIFFNFRSDRAREFTKMFVDHTFNNFKRKKIKTNFYTLTQYDSKIKNAKVIFPPVKPNDGIAKILSKKKLKQLKIAETEKYAHVTYFFNQGKDKPYEYEDRILVPSPKVKTYDLKPEMSANQITKKLLPKLKQNYSLYVVNFANGDMVGHTGNLSATISAVETVDKCVGQIVKNVDKNTYIIITADHGNCDEMVLDNGEISTAHSLNKVPFMIITNRDIQLKSNNKLSLANIAPTVLDLLGIPIPKSMEESIIKK